MKLTTARQYCTSFLTQNLRVTVTRNINGHIVILENLKFRYRIFFFDMRSYRQWNKKKSYKHLLIMLILYIGYYKYSIIGFLFFIRYFLTMEY